MLIAVAKKDPTIGGEVPGGGLSHAGYIADFPGGAPAFAAALPKGIVAGDAAAATVARRPSPPAPTSPAIARHAGRSLPRRVSVAGARRRARREQAVAAGAARSGHKIAWSSWVEIHPRRRSGSASIAATSSR